MSPSADAVATVAPLRQRVAWCFFDFANSAFPTVAVTAFGAPYFKVLVGDAGVSVLGRHLSGDAAWGFSVSLSMLLVTLSSPFMGAVADRSGRKRALLAVYVLLCVLATAGLGFVHPGQGTAAVLLYVLANFAFEGAYVFYNAFLPELTTPDRLGRLSGAGWALGYVGGLLALICAKPLIPAAYDAAHAETASKIYFVVAAWYLVFSLPALAWLRDRPPVAQTGARRSLWSSATRELWGTLRAVLKQRVILFFLVAYFFYTDAVTTVIDFTGIFTREVLRFTPGENVTLFLVMNVVAAPGALVFAQLVDRIGGKRAIMGTLVLWIVVVLGAATCRNKTEFWAVAALAAVVLGATQASSRALMARLAPADRMGAYMGLLSLSGKASAVLGPTMYGVIASVSGHRVAISVIGTFFVVALAFLWRVDESRRATSDLPAPSPDEA